MLRPAHRRVLGIAIGSATAMALAGGCGPSGSADGTGSGNSNPGQAADAADPPSGFIDAQAPADAPGERPDAETCGAQSEEIELVNLGDPPDLLIVLDRSTSMILPPDLSPTSKWQVMKDALGKLAGAKENNIRFGLLAFPTDGGCGVGAGVAVPIDLGQAQAISSWMSANGPNGDTPAHRGLQAASDYYRTVPFNDAGRYVLFATDGIPNCGGMPPDPETNSDAEVVAAVQRLSQEGIKTFVLGFGNILGLDPQVLNDAAQAGGVPRAGGPPYFYQAQNATELDQVLDTIAGGIITPSCSYELANQPPDPDLVTVTADGMAVPRSTSHTNGWDYHPDAGTITFFGSYCADIEAGVISNVDFVFGCPGPVVD